MRRREPVLHRPTVIDDDGERLFGVRKRQQVVRVVSAEAPQQRWSDTQAGSTRVTSAASASRYDAGGGSRPERQRDAVQHDRRDGPRPLQHCERAPAADHEVLGDHLEPVGRAVPARTSG
jgi:hypothetical protein